MGFATAIFSCMTQGHDRTVEKRTLTSLSFSITKVQGLCSAKTIRLNETESQLPLPGRTKPDLSIWQLIIVYLIVILLGQPWVDQLESSSLYQRNYCLFTADKILKKKMQNGFKFD
jgi:hypothetical protein